MSAPAPLLGDIELGQLDPRVLGGKGAWLHWLARQGAPVPPGFVLPVTPPDAPIADDEAALVQALEQLGGATPEAPLAVRASPVRSQPGVLPTLLGCTSLAQVVAATRQIRAAARAAAVPCAVVVQREVQAHRGGFAAALFTRDPSQGHAGPRGSYQPGGPGEDVVDGRHQLPALSEGEGSLRRMRPEDFEQLARLADTLEGLSGRILELEVVHDGQTLWVVQARPVPREPTAAIRLASERAELQPPVWLDLSAADAQAQWVERVSPEGPPLARGLAASPGVATGVPVVDPDEAERRGRAGEAIVLVRPHALPEDVPAVSASVGVLTSTGGLTCHAAVIARGLGKPAVVSCRALELTPDGPRISGRLLVPDRLLTLDGHSGAIFEGEVPRLRLPSGAPVRKLLSRLRGRRQTPLWLYGLPQSLWGEVRHLAVDALLVDAAPAPDELPEGLPVWLREPGDDHARRLDEEHSEPTRVRIVAWDDETPHEAAVVLAPEGPWPDAGRTQGLRAVAVAPAHMLAWALTLDPVQETAHNGPLTPEDAPS